MVCLGAVYLDDYIVFYEYFFKPFESLEGVLR